MTEQAGSQHALRLRKAAHEMLAVADEIDRSYKVEKPELVVTEMASLSALSVVAAKWAFERGLREEIFGSAIFGEPAWDMLLYLFMKAGERKRVLKTAVTSASGSSHSTALRYLSMLEVEGVVQIEKAQSDKRAQLVSLTPMGLLKMSACLARAMQKERLGVDTLSQATTQLGKHYASSSSERAFR
ncbi:MAG: hypothetical protein P1U62_13175 [Alteraurantiacibacter sp. bin_em_oilr2.035]|nr:hypothetical protein [Alteraurantiacibacter sp. bin_em_oilr2.035]